MFRLRQSLVQLVQKGLSKKNTSMHSVLEYYSLFGWGVRTTNTISITCYFMYRNYSSF